MLCPHCGFDNLPGQDECRRCLGDLTALDRPTPQNRVEQSLMTETVGLLNPRPPVIVPTGTSVAEAITLLLQRETGALLVVDQAGELVGIFSERDLLTRLEGQPAPSSHMAIDQFMTPRPQTVGIDDNLAVALKHMDVGGYRHLPVMRDGKPVGILSVRDVLKHVTQMC